MVALATSMLLSLDVLTFAFYSRLRRVDMQITNACKSSYIEILILNLETQTVSNDTNRWKIDVAR